MPGFFSRRRTLPLRLAIATFAAAVLVACGAAKPTAAAAPGPSAVLTPQPTVPAAASPSAPAQPALAPVQAGERPELVRKWLALNQERRTAVPEDYEAGIILTSLPEAGSAEGLALEAARQLFADLKSGRPAGGGSAFLDRFLAAHQDQFRSVQLARFLAGTRWDGGEAAFPVRLLGVNASTRMEVFLSRTGPDGSWAVADLQGDPGLLNEARENRFGGYRPQDIERKMIEEGNGKPWL
jgi:hypothetical protein